MSKTKMQYAQEVYELVAPIAAGGGTIAYSEVKEAVGIPWPVQSGHMGDVLFMVLLQDPKVAAAIVTKETGKPGRGFYVARDIVRGWRTGKPSQAMGVADGLVKS